MFFRSVPTQQKKKKKSALILKQKANCSMSPWLILPVAGVTPCYHEQNQVRIKGFDSPTLNTTSRGCEHIGEQQLFLCLTGTDGDSGDRRVKDPPGHLPSCQCGQREVCTWVKAGTEHLPDDSTAGRASPSLPEVGGKFPTDFRGWNQGHEKHVDGTNPFFPYCTTCMYVTGSVKSSSASWRGASSHRCPIFSSPIQEKYVWNNGNKHWNNSLLALPAFFLR